MVQEAKAERPGDALLLNAALETIPFGFCVWSSDFTLVMWNRHYLDIYGFPARAIRQGMSLFEVVELSCRLGNHPDTDPKGFFEAYAAELTGNRSGLRVVNLEETAGGRTLETSHVYAPGLGWVVTHEDVTDEIARADMMAESKRELARQYGLLDAAINNISHGLSMFDKDFRLMASNAEFARMYALPPELTRPGTAFRDILEYRRKVGRHAPEDIDAYIAERRRVMRNGRFVNEIAKMADGTYISFRHQPLEGGGMVTTHEDITGQLATEAQMRHLATHDALTDLPNRALFREDVEQSCAGLGSGRSFSLLLVNLDNFKFVNDSEGHETGDKVLQAVASRLKETVGGEGLVARLGGDEFAVLAPGISDPAAVADLARTILTGLDAPFRFGRKPVRLRASVGMAVAPGDGQNADTLMSNADLALIKAKEEEPGTYRFFESGMDAKFRRRRLLETGLRDALSNKELALHFQPLISALTGAVVCAEALLRWDHPELGSIAPAEFIPVAEDTGLIVPLGAWVIETACHTAAGWAEDVKVAVNLSPLQFTRAGLLETVWGALMASGLSAGRLELEITESLLLKDSAANIEMLHALRGLGVGIALDDFGTGYSSLSYLRAFPFDKIKIDRSFMTDIAARPENRAILAAMIGLGKSLGMETVVEGIETAEQLSIVTREGCSQIQGFYYSPPVDAETFAGLIGADGLRLRSVRRSG
ncbi:putative bifunctional diguanylate cyclase/phosphodiesterase [Pelagibacterium limicola]|uniref:putative bifunctional diguanylate cyclase/phosphodiesterase n=1 Tax=Pelagibacterium limicola TaxID=2791022 RepID=UPI0018AFA0B4|nr:EAL domain-containing protein [Pelagibacterium limicola]